MTSVGDNLLYLLSKVECSFDSENINTVYDALLQ